MKKDIYGRQKGKPCEVCGGEWYPHSHSLPKTEQEESEKLMDEMAYSIGFMPEDADRIIGFIRTHKLLWEKEAQKRVVEAIDITDLENCSTNQLAYAEQELKQSLRDKFNIS